MNDPQNTSFAYNQTQSYVDAYTPPSTTPAVAPPTTPENSVQSAPGISGVVSPASVAPPAFTPAPVATDEPAMPMGDTPLEALDDEFVPPPTSSSSEPQGLGEQNIFSMLGVSDGTEAQKEGFLDELQQVIWEDFLENDVELLISSEDYLKLKELLKGQQSVDLEQQEKIVVFLEQLIPDLEDIMLEKALALKGDMFKERIAGMRQFFAGKPADLSKIDQAEQLMQQDQWRSASELLNTMRG